ncbi:hypothetical protein GCM10007879_01890 [Maritalea porphyrae]|uniref:Phage holin family protein n=2 Tax=Maritalea porphyrae TaxID=880732 RepID=A0ABQ5UM74_9HYPH|nr:hypothetical protein GCM10007879_01890 [Maritalea porphyrae]
MTMQVNKKAHSSPLDRLVGTITSRVQTNSLLLVIALISGTTAYLALLFAAWYGIVEQTNAVIASLSIAAIASLTTILVVLFRYLRDQRRKVEQQQLQTQAINSLIFTAISAATKSKATLAPLIAIAGLALTQKSPRKPQPKRLAQ